MTTTPVSGFDRVMGFLQFPTLILPLVGGILISAAPNIDSILAIADSIFLFILAGSMVLNSWIGCRHPQVWATGALGRGQSIGNLVLTSALLVWLALLTTIILDGAGSPSTGISGAPLTPVTEAARWGMIGMAAIVSAASIAALWGAVRSRRRPVPHLVPPAGSRFTAIRRMGLAYLTVVVAIAVGALILSFTGRASMAIPALLALGLPWSFPLAALGLGASLTSMAELNDGTSSLAWSDLLEVARFAVPLALNVGIAAILVWSDRGRTAVIHWFFKLKVVDHPTTIPSPS